MTTVTRFLLLASCTINCSAIAQETPPPPLAAARSSLESITITGDKNVPENRLVKLTVALPEGKFAVLWDIYPEETADHYEFNNMLIFTGPKGRYQVKLRVIDSDMRVKTLRGTYTIGGDSETGSAPAPAQKVGYVIFMSDPAKKTPAEAAFENDPKLEALVKSLGAKFLVGSITNPQLKGKYDDMIYGSKGPGLPAMILLGEVNREGISPAILAVRTPTTLNEVSRIIKEQKP